MAPIPMPLFDSLCRELGFDVLLERYFDKDMNVRKDAPQQLKDEVDELRRDYVYRPGVR